MGTIQIDTYSKVKRLEDNFSYSAAGIKTMLENYTMLSKDSCSVDIKIDLDRALASTLLSPGQRLALAFVFVLEMNLLQASKLAHSSISKLNNDLAEAMDILEAVINGYKTDRHKHRKSKATNIDVWLHEVAAGQINIFDLPPAAASNHLSLLANDFNDLLAIETINQRIHGKPAKEMADIMGLFPYDVKRYPFHLTSKAIESPEEGKPYNPIKDGYDYFFKQDTNNGVERNNLFNFPADATKTGTRSGTIKTEDGQKGVKNNVYK